jgi:hypothetical protein
MAKIGASWLERLALELSLSAAQRDSVGRELEVFCAKFQDIRWARGAERDVEADLAALYEATESAMKGHLTRDQAAAFRGMPRDWGHGELIPGPGR